MNLWSAFNRAKSVEDYIELLGDQQKLHNLHFSKAEITGEIPYFEKLNILVITETWCSDSTAISPVLLKMFKEKNADIRVALRDENTELIDQFLTNGSRSIPIILVMDESFNLIMRYGPRPAIVQDIFEAHRQNIADGKIEKKKVSQKIRSFYAKDRGRTISEDFLNSLNKASHIYVE